MSNNIVNDNNSGLPLTQHKISVLYVDDEENLLDLGKLFLEDTGEFQVHTMNSAMDALDSPQIQSFDAIVSDYQMPEMDGIEFLKAFRQRFTDIPFIIFTGRGREEVVIEAIDNGVDFYIQKGGDAKSQYAELSHKIKQAVRRKQAERSHRDSEKRLSDIIEFLPDATFAIDQDGRVIAWNRAIEEMTGVSSSDMLGKGDFEYAIPFYGSRRPLLIDLMYEPIEKIEPYYSNIYLKGDSISAETYNSFPKGLRITTLNKACPLYNQAGEITGAIESIRDITKAKQTEFSLKENESKFRNLVEYSRDSIFIVDFTGIIHFINPTGLLSINEENSDVIVGRKNLRDYLHPDWLDKFTRDLTRITQGFDGYITQYKLITNSNREIWVEGHGRKIPHQQSESILISWRDITNRKLAEDALRESEEKFRNFAELQPQTIFEMDLDFKITYVNEHGRSIKDAPVSNIKEGYSALSYIHSSYHEKIKENTLKLIEGIPYEMEEYHAVRKDGSTYPVNIYSSPIFRDGKVTGIRGVIIDLSEQKRIETELVESEKKFRALVEQSLDGIIIIDFSGNLLFLNPRIGQIMGYPLIHNHDNIREFNIFSFILPEYLDQVHQDLEKIKSGIDNFLVNYPISTFDNRTIWIECIGRKISYTGIPALLLSIHDITERKNAEDALRESEKKMSNLFKNSPVALTLVSANNGTFIDVNETFARMSGYDRSDVIGKTAEMLGLFPHPAEYQNLISSLREEKSIQGMEISIRNASGDVNICRFSSGFIVIGGKSHVLSSIEDITENINMQSAFKTLVQSMVGTTGLNSLHSITKNMVSWLNADCIMIGEIIPDQSSVHVLSMILDGEYVSDFSYSLKGTPCENVQEKGFCLYSDDVINLFPESPDLQKLNIRGYIGTPLHNFEGKVIGILCVLFRNPIQKSPSIQKIIDIIAVKAAAEIERNQIERFLIQSQQALEEAMDMAKLANWEYDVPTEMFTFNDRFYALYGTTAEHEGGYLMDAESYVKKFLYPGEFVSVAKELIKAVETTDPEFQTDVEHRIIRRDGEVRSMNIRIRITKDAQGRTIKTHGVNQDITERKRSEDVIRKANRQLSLLTSITRHDILNKITTAYAILDPLTIKNIESEISEKIRIAISIIEEIQSLIEFTRIYEEIGSHNPQWIHLNSIFSRLCIPDSITLKTDLPDLDIFADPLLPKVVSTFLDNSIRHGQGVTEIRVSAIKADDNIMIAWEDNGAGVRREEKDEIFDKGFGKNTGFGLYLAREILSLTDISIKENGIPGFGVRFEMIVPDGMFRIIT